MELRARFYPILAVFLALWPQPSQAVDETAADLVAQGEISLSLMTDTLNKKYPNERENFWNVSGIAYHDFSSISHSDVIIGLSGYKDVGKNYNNGKQLVEDAGAGFAYFHLEKNNWKLEQVEVVEGKKYEGFEGADLAGIGRDQLVVYSSNGKKQIALVYSIQGGVFKKLAVMVGYGLGPRVTQEGGQPLMVDFQRALINPCDECGIYYGRPYHWTGEKFLEDDNDFLNQVQAYDPFHSTADEAGKSLAFFEGYLAAHPDDFCAAANCYDLSNRLGLKDKIGKYLKLLAQIGDKQPQCQYCDEWLRNKNKATQQDYLDKILGKKKSANPALNFNFF